VNNRINLIKSVRTAVMGICYRRWTQECLISNCSDPFLARENVN